MTGGEYYRAVVDAVRGRGNYFKATRLDGCSFADSAFQYAVGETATAEGARRILCCPGLLHLADVPAETLVGGDWPCRLFEVAPSEIIASHGHKFGAKSLTVVRELPSWLALGPNGRIAAKFVCEVESLDAAALDAALDAARAAAWDAAWAAADWDAAWAAARAAARAAAWDAAAARAAARAAAAARDAATALVLADLITPKQFATLYAPFAKALPLDELRKRAIAAYPLTVQP